MSEEKEERNIGVVGGYTIVKKNSWEDDGDCKVCRRLKYCTKRCKANNSRITSMINTEMVKRSPAIGAYGAMNNGHR